MVSTQTSHIAPAEVHATLGRHILADGLGVVFDYEKSKGPWLYDSKNNRKILDFAAFFASQPIGYNHPKMKDAAFLEVLHRVAQLKPSLSDLFSVEYAEAVETFARYAKPDYLPHAFFIESGTLAVENALKVAFDWKVRRNKAKGIQDERGSQVIHFRDAFHGRSGYTLSLTNTDPKKTDYFPKFPWPRISNPMLRFPVTAEVEREVRAAEEQALDEIRRAFAENPDDIAAIIIEPIQSEGGDHHFRGEFLRTLQTLCDGNECFFVVDEVQTGVGITGKFWAHEHFGLRPDALAFAKKTQLGGCLVGPKVDQEPENVFVISSRINSTWGGNLTDLVRCARYLEIIDEDDLVENARVVGDYLLAGLTEIQNELGGLVTNSRGRGFLIAFDLPDGEVRQKAVKALAEAGMLVLGCGPRSIRFRPALSLTRDEASQGLEIVRHTLARL